MPCSATTVAAAASSLARVSRLRAWRGRDMVASIDMNRNVRYKLLPKIFFFFFFSAPAEGDEGTQWTSTWPICSSTPWTRGRSASDPVADGRRRTYAELEERGELAGAPPGRGRGIGPGDHVGIYGVNSVEWIESLWAIFKLRAVWININYRYVADELAYLFGNADLKALIHDAAFSDRVAGVASHMPELRHRLVIGVATLTGQSKRHDALRGDARPPARPSALRSPLGRRPGLYPLYMGGTTGMPKGVVWRHADVLFAGGGGIDILSGERATRPEDLAERGRRLGFALTFLPIAPLTVRC